MKFFKFFLGFVIICIFTVFATSNMQRIHLNFLSSSLIGYQSIEKENAAVRETNQTEPEKTPRQIPVFLLVYMSFAIGFIVSWFLSIGMNKGHKKKIKLLTSETKKQTKELESLRNLPVSDTESTGMESISTLPVSPDSKV